MTEPATDGLRPLWLTENYPPSRGGMAESCDRIVRGLRALGMAVDVAHLTRRDVPWSVTAQAGGRYLACPVGDDGSHALNRLWEVLSADRATRTEVTHVVAFGGHLPLTAGPIFAAWLGLPHVALIRGNDFDVGVFSPRRAAALDGALARSAAICAVSRDKVEKIAALWGGDRVVWTPNAIDLGRWVAAPSDRERARRFRAENVARGRRVVGVFGELKRKKGGPFLLEALARSGAADRLHLLLAGWREPELEEWLAREGAGVAHTSIEFVDRYDLLAHYLACDLVAIPSFYDGMPNVMVEAAALGVPLVASRTGGMADFLVDGENALLFAPGDLDGCAAALARAARLSEGELGALGDAARALAEREFDHALEARRYAGVLSETAGVSAARGAGPFGELPEVPAAG